MTLILASGSAARRALLSAAGLAFEAVAPSLDEDAAKAALRAEGATPREVALRLAELKALSVSKQSAGLVIGADQVLALGDRVFDKPASIGQAREHLLALSGQTHELLTAATIARDGEIVWRMLDAPRLTMRTLTDAFIDDYLARVGDAATKSVGAYQLEGLGVQLFERIEGDYFSILGLPLLPLLALLREQGTVPT
jgi:septum formation protein